VQPDVQAVKVGTPQKEPPSQKLGQAVTLPTLQAVRLPLKGVPRANISSIWVTFATFQVERSPLNEVAAENMRHVLVTLAMSQDESTLLKEEALENISFM
jgi:hypothetical protein